MNIPPLLLAATLVFWGFETTHLILGLIGAVLVGSVTVINHRLSLSDDDFVRVSDLTSIIFLAAVVLIFLNVEKVFFLKYLVLWLPLVLLPLLLSQLYTGKERIIIGTRFGFRKNRAHKHDPLDFRHYYLGLCFFSAAMANSRSVYFFPMVGSLIFWLLLVNRGKAFSVPFFICVFAASLGIGIAGFKGAETVHEYFRDKTRMFFRNYYFSRHADPFKAHITFGDLGRLTLSDEILLRIETAGAVPGLLRQASYELFNQNSWYSGQPFDYLVVSRRGWDLMKQPKTPGSKAKVEFYLPKEKGLLPQPYGSYLVRGPTLYELEQKQDGVTRILDGASLVTYEILYNDTLTRETDLPTHRNRAVGPGEVDFIKGITGKWDISTLTERERMSLVERYFLNGFSYSLDLVGNGNFQTALENFLVEVKKGHCELFATATTLMLRSVGIPSRYVTGFMVAEKSEFENRYIVRDRHAHAWSEAYVNGRWVIVDTTPASWFAIENPARSTLQQLEDIFSYYKLQFDHFRIRTEQNYRTVLSGITVILAAILVFRIYRRMNATRSAGALREQAREFASIDSPLYDIEQRLERMGIARYADESFLAWVRRIDAVHEVDIGLLERIYRMHQRLRFDPHGLRKTERRTLDDLADGWIHDHLEVYIPVPQEDHRTVQHL